MPTAELTLPGEPESARHARRFLAETLAGWGAGRWRDQAELVVSELVGNAALHARTDICVRVRLNRRALRLEVSDSSPRMPQPRHYSAEATTGRGLAMVAAVGRRWGVDPDPEGKTIWVELDNVPRRGGGERQGAVAGMPDLDAYPDLEDPGQSPPGEPRAGTGSAALCRAAA
ncbi:MAG: ATP-binding protein [Acidimicrobiales bacterium]